MLWTASDVDPTAAEALAEAVGVSPVVANLLIQRGIDAPEAAEVFLRPRLAQLDDPFAMSHLRAAAERIEAAIDAGESVVVFGDYDVDGVTSTVQLVSFLRRLGLDPKYCVPRRLEEGYGLSREAIDRIFDGQLPELFIALDCGTNAHEPIAYLRGLGVDVIVVDHHQTKSSAPQDCIFVNPHVNDPADVPWRNLCTAGLVFKLLHGLLKNLRARDDRRVEGLQLKDFLDLVALGTIADLVPLQGENRLLSWYGLRHLQANGRPGLSALARVAGIRSGKEMGSADVSFRLAPRINASGRLADASLPIELLLGADAARCQTIAGELDAMNRERQTIERRIAKAAETRASEEFADAPGIVLYDKDWHPGVVGIVASRVSRHFHKPCIILGAEGDLAKGSGRSVASVDLVAVFQRCAHLLGHWGGHPMAAGLSLPADAVPAFTRCFLDGLAALYPEGLPEASLELSAWLQPDDLGETLLEELERLSPFGQGNREPVFGLRGVALEAPADCFGEGHFRFRLTGGPGQQVAGIAWRMGPPPEPGRPVDMAVRFSWNYWRDHRYPQITLIDWKPSGESPG
jgi:single-stranded-DNA-specific exonuclease